MKVRGRKSAAALSVVTPFPGQRPEPPTTLTDEQAEEWRGIVGRMPADWLTRENEALLIAYVRHVSRANVLAKAIDAFDAEWLAEADGLQRYDKLLQMGEREGRAISSLATRMRLTQQSRYKAEKAATAISRSGAARKPWQADS